MSSAATATSHPGSADVVYADSGNYNEPDDETMRRLATECKKYGGQSCYVIWPGDGEVDNPEEEG